MSRSVGTSKVSPSPERERYPDHGVGENGYLTAIIEQCIVTAGSVTVTVKRRLEKKPSLKRGPRLKFSSHAVSVSIVSTASNLSPPDKTIVIPPLMP